MLTEYIEAAMSHAQYEVIEDGTVYGEIPGLQGVWGNAATHAACVEELRDSLEGWIVLGLRLGHTLPIVNGINLNMVAAAA